MKPFCAVLVALLMLGCRTTEPREVATKRFPHVPEEPTAGGGEPEADYRIDRASVVGTWLNGSCGDRQYQRKITFNDDGTFVAVDEIAPCPEDSTCVAPGIAHWHGIWKVENQVIAIEAVPAENEKLPDQIPEAFVVVAEEPLSIGERIGQTVCPYRPGE